MTWRYHTPERDGHAPDDWVDGLDVQFRCIKSPIIMWATYPTPDTTRWYDCFEYRYRPLQTVEPSFDTLKDQCLAPPQDQREAPIEAMQKPTLLPCPFCGGECELQDVWGYWKVRGAHLPGCPFHCHEPSTFGTQDSAIAAWNRRAS